MVTHMQDNKAPAKTQAKPPAEKKSKWTKDDTELSILALPTTIWYRSEERRVGKECRL